MVVKVKYSIDNVICEGFYKLEKDDLFETEAILKSFFREMSLETGLKYELQSFEIITKCLIEL